MRIALVVMAFAVAAAPLARAQPDPAKVIRAVFPTAETGFDPQAAGDIYSNAVNRVIFDTPYKYDYLARPYKLIPNTAVALPEVSDGGKVWTIRIKPGITFADDPAFKGRKRELTAYDYVYSWKRVMDPRMRSNSMQMFDGRFEGMDDLVNGTREGGKFDYDKVIAGLQAVDRYTIRMKLSFPDTELMANLTTTAAAAVAREVVEAYGDGSGWVMANPVGTGPYRLKEWRRGQRIVLEASPTFRDERFPDSSDPADRALVAKYKGKRIPFAGRVEISVIEESNPRLLAFEGGELDYTATPTDLVWMVMDPPAKLKPRLAERGITLSRGVQPAITYTYFNMEDPLVGGYTPEKVALRRAFSLGYNVDEEVRVIRQGQAFPATQVIPPTVSGHDPKLENRKVYDPSAAKALLDRFGYKDRDGDGWRETPDGKPLVLKLASAPSAIDRQYDELRKRSTDAIGLKVEFVKQKWPDLLKAARLGQLQMFTLGNINTTPEGFGFLGLLYGGNSGFSNLARFRLPEYDKLYEQARSLPYGPERERIMQRMNELVTVYAPWNITVFRYENVLVQPWITSYKYSGYTQHPFPYLDVDPAKRRAAGR
ncbi:MAG: ABC transporter substrate-binding protein [Betaproteobacteria bacterium]